MPLTLSEKMQAPLQGSLGHQLSSPYELNISAKKTRFPSLIDTKSVHTDSSENYLGVVHVASF